MSKGTTVSSLACVEDSCQAKVVVCWSSGESRIHGETECGVGLGVERFSIGLYRDAFDAMVELSDVDYLIQL